MARIAFIADLHIANHRKFGGPVVDGLNSRCVQILRALAEATSVARAMRCDHIMILGDIFDTARPTPPQIAAVMAEVARADVVTTAILGNHDINTLYSGDHALSPLYYNTNVVPGPHLRIVDSTAIYLLPYSDVAGAEYVEKSLTDLQNPPVRAHEATPDSVAIGVHMGISDEDTKPYLRQNDSIEVGVLGALMEKHGISFAFAGNWHTHRRWDIETKRIVQCGALVPTGFDNQGTQYGYVTVWDSVAATLIFHQVPGPRFFSTRFEDEKWEQIIDLAKDENLLYFRVNARPGNMKRAAETFAKLKADKTIADYEVLPDREAVSASAKVAAHVARSATTVDKAVVDYTNKIAKQKGLDAAQVLTLVQRYLARG